MKLTGQLAFKIRCQLAEDNTPREIPLDYEWDLLRQLLWDKNFVPGMALCWSMKDGSEVNER